MSEALLGALLSAALSRPCRLADPAPRAARHLTTPHSTVVFDCVKDGEQIPPELARIMVGLPSLQSGLQAPSYPVPLTRWLAYYATTRPRHVLTLGDTRRLVRTLISARNVTT